jgi:hypothetical protein
LMSSLSVFGTFARPTYDRTHRSEALAPVGRSRCEHLAAGAVLRDDRAKCGI